MKFEDGGGRSYVCCSQRQRSFLAFLQPACILLSLDIQSADVHKVGSKKTGLV